MSMKTAAKKKPAKRVAKAAAPKEAPPAIEFYSVILIEQKDRYDDDKWKPAGVRQIADVSGDDNEFGTDTIGDNWILATGAPVKVRCGCNEPELRARTVTEKELRTPPLVALLHDQMWHESFRIKCESERLREKLGEIGRRADLVERTCRWLDTRTDEEKNSFRFTL